MKSPDDIAKRLARQWNRTETRIERLLDGEWPLCLTIGKPVGKQVIQNAVSVQAHITRWREVTIGEIVWKPTRFRGVDEPIELPVRWELNTPSEWIEASQDNHVIQEFKTLEQIVSKTNPLYREIFVRERSLWRSQAVGEVVATAKLADELSPGIAKGRPLRLLAGWGVDTKFFERNGKLLVRLLDERFDGAASEQGLHVFLDAFNEGDHWVMVIPLERSLLPFRRQRVTTRELAETLLPCTHLLVVENEQCSHLLPPVNNTIAILGAGLDLSWLRSSVFGDKTVGYWGDLDSWGMLMLARARQHCPQLCPLLMERPVFDRHIDLAVTEPVCAGGISPDGLTGEESAFYQYLIGLHKGRLEQEYIAESEVSRTIEDWRKAPPA